MRLSKRQTAINFVALLAVFLMQTFDNALRDSEIHIPLFSLVKNGTLFLVLCIYLWEIYLLNCHEHKFVFTEELRSIVVMATAFLMLSLFFMIKNHGVCAATFEGLFRVVLPVVVAFAVLNVMALQDIYRIMSLFLLFSFGIYLCTIGIGKLTFANFADISWLMSYSPFESNFFSPTAMSLCVFFCYFRKNKFYTALSVIFSIMTFKRLMVLYAVILLLCGSAVAGWRRPSKWMLRFVKTTFFIITVAYILLNLRIFNDPIQKWLGISLDQFTMGRTWLFENIYYHLKSIGFMSSTLHYRSMEMDLPQIYVEMGILSVIIAIHCIIEVSKANWYNLLIGLFILLELLTSHWFDITYFWIIAYITMGCTAYKMTESNSYMRGKRTVQRKKLRFVVKAL